MIEVRHPEADPRAVPGLSDHMPAPTNTLIGIPLLRVRDAREGPV
jgi:hypothetical protein